MVVAPGDNAAAGHDAPGSWRDELTRRVAKASIVLYGLATALSLTVEGPRQRLALAAAGIICCLLVGLQTLTGRPKGKLRAWFVISPAMIASVAGFGIVGFLAGPAVMLTVTVMLGGLLLGRRAMLALSVVALIGIGAIAFAMVHGLLPLPSEQNVSMAHGLNWFRTIAVMFVAIGLMGTLLIGIVGQVERLLLQAKRDVLLREQAEQARAQAELVAMTNRQLETIGRLAAGIAHDFNNNLATIIGSAELMKEELHENRVSAELLEGILASSQRAAELTRQLLAYSRKAQMVLVPSDLHQHIENTVAILRRSSDPKVQLETRLNAENASVLADASLFDNTLLNLLVNARDAMPRGGKITISTSNYEVTGAPTELEYGLPPGAYLLIEVLDTGEGIPADILPNIFEPFFTTKTIGKGTGLGLAAVVGTVKSLKGSIDVESETGCGTAFRILLPCDHPADSMVTREAAQIIKGRGRVLLVDDDALVRQSAAATLQSLGYQVTKATDGIHALELFQNSTEQFQLVILDLRMPRMDGATTYKELHRLAPDLPIIIWSGYGGELDVEALLRQGAAGFIQKPYGIVDFSHVVFNTINTWSKDTAEANSA